MSSFRVDFATGGNFQEALSRHTKEIADALVQMDKDLQPQLASWEGTTVDAYNRAKEMWNNTLNEMQVSLHSGNQTFGTISDNFQHTERSLTNSWNQ